MKIIGVKSSIITIIMGFILSLTKKLKNKYISVTLYGSYVESYQEYSGSPTQSADAKIHHQSPAKKLEKDNKEAANCHKSCSRSSAMIGTILL